MTRQSLDDEELLRRFIVGDITEEERRPIEERLFVDTDYFDSIAALEHEMFVDLAHGRLHARWAGPLRTAVDASPDRRRHFDEVRNMLAVLPQAARPSRWYLWAAAAVVVLVAGGLARWPLVTSAPDAPTLTTPQALRSYVLEPGPTRSASETGNTIDLSDAPGAIRLVAVLDAPADAVVTASARPIGGRFLEIPGATTSRRVPSGLEVTWEVPAASWTAGDYLIEYSAGPDAGGATIGTRFVRIER